MPPDHSHVEKERIKVSIPGHVIIPIRWAKLELQGPKLGNKQSSIFIAQSGERDAKQEKSSINSDTAKNHLPCSSEAAVGGVDRTGKHTGKIANVKLLPLESC